MNRSSRRHRLGGVLRGALSPIAVVLWVPACDPSASQQRGPTPSQPERTAAVVASAPPPAPASSPEPPKNPTIMPPRGGPTTFAAVVRSADRSVVSISTLGAEGATPLPFGRRTQPREQKGLGSGFIVERDGVILTNHHVIAGSRGISVKLADDRVFDAKVVGTDEITDLAVLRIGAKELPTLPLGDSDLSEVGDWVVAIGNPYGLDHTVSAGIISAKGRTREKVPIDNRGFYDFIQTDASINPGNSGGPLLNLAGEVIAINTAIRSDAQGIGFAIPINMVKQLLPMLLRDGHVTRSALGISIMDLRDVPANTREQLKLLDDKGAPVVASGAVVRSVNQGGPADKAGLLPGDVIVAFEGRTITRSTQLQWWASTHGVGRTASIRVIRDGKPVEVKVKLGQLDWAR